VKILAIRFARLGDVILLLPALVSLKRRLPDSDLTLLTGHRCAPIAELCPAIDHVMAVDRVAMRDGPWWRALRDMGKLIGDIRNQQFDIVVDFHSFRETNLLTWLSGSPVRIGMKRHNEPYLAFCFNRAPVLEDKTIHVSDMFNKVVDTVVGSESMDARSGTENVLGRLTVEKSKQPAVALYVDAPVPERIWPPERFAALADFMIEEMEARVLVIASREGAGLAREVGNASRNKAKLTVLTDLNVHQLAASIASVHLLVSNDTGPMHIGPAVGVSTLGLFSVGFPEHFRPIGVCDQFLRANPIAAIPLEDVIRAVKKMWVTAVDPGLRR
jgi:ADP-heptose:LPS heptosyltransferase